ncbi:hypothetical protein EU534_01670 [Candidatus Heimdallarchaeota archaeon]|nr:MAG: hypothetical protein EU534_01670 [Candidatus Heimdallarchaeota archaeon]
MSIDQIQDLKLKSRIKPSPWISAVLALVSSIGLVFLLLASMEQAFSFVEDFFSRTPNALWFFQIPLPLLSTLMVFFIAQRSQKESLNTLFFLSTALGTGIIGMIIYFILFKYSSLRNNSKADFYYILILSSISILVGLLAILTLKPILKKRTLREGLDA